MLVRGLCSYKTIYLKLPESYNSDDKIEIFKFDRRPVAPVAFIRLTYAFLALFVLPIIITFRGDFYLWVWAWIPFLGGLANVIGLVFFLIRKKFIKGYIHGDEFVVVSWWRTFKIPLKDIKATRLVEYEGFITSFNFVYSGFHSLLFATSIELDTCKGTIQLPASRSVYLTKAGTEDYAKKLSDYLSLTYIDYKDKMSDIGPPKSAFMSISGGSGKYKLLAGLLCALGIAKITWMSWVTLIGLVFILLLLYRRTATWLRMNTIY